MSVSNLAPCPLCIGFLEGNFNHPVVKLVTQTYSTGVRLTKKAMEEIENKIERLTNFTEDNLPNLGKWFIDICCKVT